MARGGSHDDSVRSLLIDLDGVLRTWDAPYDADLERRHGLAEGSLAAAAFGAESLLDDAVRGRIDDAAWRAEVVRRLGGSAAEVVVTQPDPEVFVAACRLLGVEPEGVVFVDHTSVNMAAAAAVGLDAHLHRTRGSSPGYWGWSRWAAALTTLTASRPG